MAPYDVDAGDFAELREGRLFVSRSRDPQTGRPLYGRIVGWTLQWVQFDEIRRRPGRRDELVRWDMLLGDFFAQVFDHWHVDELPDD